MQQMKLRIILLGCVLVSGLVLSQVPLVMASPLAQQPTVSIPTVTSSPSGPKVTVNLDREWINVWSGPGKDYPKVGILVAGQTVPASGRSSGEGVDFWVQISYPGVLGGVAWVYGPLVTISGHLSLVHPPPTPTPRGTPTVDPTLASQFVINIVPTRLPTFTPPPPLIIPTFTAGSPEQITFRVPIGFIIIGMAVVGFFGGLITILRNR